MRHFVITIKVAYDETTIPEDMVYELERNLDTCAESGLLFGDSGDESIIEEWDATVEEKQ